MDNIRPKGTVEVTCAKCGWAFWVEPLDSRLPDGPFVCPSCEDGVVKVARMAGRAIKSLDDDGSVLRAELEQCKAQLAEREGEVEKWKRDFLHYAQHDRRCECTPPCHLQKPKCNCGLAERMAALRTGEKGVILK